MRHIGRLNLTLLLCFAVVYGVATLFFYVQIDRQYRDELAEATERQMQTAQAVRRFTIDNVRPGLLQDTQEFHAAAVPSFAANQTMSYLQAIYPGKIYREVALNPTNPRNLAQGWEVEAIQEFQRTNSASISTMLTSSSGTTLNYAKPIVVDSKACLVCHGSPQAAPKNLLAKYGSENGFGWRVGEIIGAQVVSVPTQLALKRRNETLLHYLVTSLVVAGVGFAFLGIVLRRAVLRPIESAGNEWRMLASVDPLTGAANRRRLVDLLDMLSTRTSAESPASTVFVDIDYFKKVNDEFGHTVGDVVLREFARRLQRALRRKDILCRYGGEEFAIILENTDERAALDLANELRLEIASSPFSANDGDGHEVSIAITASFGVAELSPGKSTNEVLARADKALYVAKNQGRNRCICASALESGDKA